MPLVELTVGIVEAIGSTLGTVIDSGLEEGLGETLDKGVLGLGLGTSGEIMITGSELADVITVGKAFA